MYDSVLNVFPKKKACLFEETRIAFQLQHKREHCVVCKSDLRLVSSVRFSFTIDSSMVKREILKTVTAAVAKGRDSAG